MYTVPEYAKIYLCNCDATLGKHKLISHKPELLRCSYFTTGNSEIYLHNKSSKGRFQRHDYHLALVFIKHIMYILTLKITVYIIFMFYVFF